MMHSRMYNSLTYPAHAMLCFLQVKKAAVTKALQLEVNMSNAFIDVEREYVPPPTVPTEDEGPQGKGPPRPVHGQTLKYFDSKEGTAAVKAGLIIEHQAMPANVSPLAIL